MKKNQNKQKNFLEEVIKARHYALTKKEKEARIQKMYPKGVHENPGTTLEVDFSKLKVNLDEVRIGHDKDGKAFQCSLGQILVMIVKEINERLEFTTNFYKNQGKNMAYTIEEFRNIPNLLNKDLINIFSIPYESDLPLDQTPYRDHVEYSKFNPYEDKVRKKHFR